MFNLQIDVEADNWMNDDDMVLVEQVVGGSFVSQNTRIRQLGPDRLLCHHQRGHTTYILPNVQRCIVISPSLNIVYLSNTRP